MKWLTSAVLIVCAGLATASCSTDGMSSFAPKGTMVDVKTAQDAASNQAGTLKDLKTTVDGLTPTNVVTEKPKAQQLTSDAQGQNKQIGTALGSAAKDSAKDQKVIAVATAKPDATKVRLQWIGLGFLVSGIVALVLGFFLSTYIPLVAPWLRSGGCAAIVIGICILSIAYFLHALVVTVGCLVLAAAVGGGVWVYLHRAEIVPDLKDVLNWFKSAVPVASAPVVPVAVHKDVA